MRCVLGNSVRKGKSGPPEGGRYGRRLEEAAADAIRQIGQIDDREKVDGLEFAVDGRWAANAAGDFKVSAEEARRAGGLDGSAGGLAGLAGLRICAKRCGDEVLVLQRIVDGDAVVFVLGSDGAAAYKVGDSLRVA